MAPQTCLDFSASSTPRDRPLGVSPSSHSLAKPSFEGFGQRPPPAERRAIPLVRIIRIVSPKLVKIDAANFRALVQQLTGNSSGSSDSAEATVRDSVKKIRREEKRRRKEASKIQALAARKVIAPTSVGGRSNQTQTQYNAFPSKLFREGDVNNSESPSMESCISWESSESVDHSVFREVNVELPLFPPLTYLCDQDNSLLEDQYWRLTMPTTTEERVRIGLQLCADM